MTKKCISCDITKENVDYYEFVNFKNNEPIYLCKNCYEIFKPFLRLEGGTEND